MHLFSLIDQSMLTKNTTLLRYFSNQTGIPLNISGMERQALALLVNLVGNTESLLSEKEAIKALCSDAFWYKVQAAINGLLTHNVKFLDSRTQGYIFAEQFSNEKQQHYGLYIGSHDILRGRRTGYAYNAMYMKAKKFLLTEFIWQTKQTSLANEIMVRGDLVTYLIDMGASPEHINAVRTSLYRHISTPFPDEALEPQILLPHKSGQYIAVTPVSSHKLQGELHRRLGSQDYRPLRSSLIVGNGPNIATFGDLHSDCRGRIRVLSANLKNHFPFWRYCLFKLKKNGNLLDLPTGDLLLPDPRNFEFNDTGEPSYYQNKDDNEKIETVMQQEIIVMLGQYIRLKKYFCAYPKSKSLFMNGLDLYSIDKTLLSNPTKPGLTGSEKNELAFLVWTFWIDARSCYLSVVHAKKQYKNYFMRAFTRVFMQYIEKGWA